jgi:hypothetical protein
MEGDETERGDIERPGEASRGVGVCMDIEERRHVGM